uniref:SS18 N-terminal domain-containing protein n=1 Tax=Solanum lycopersicum TaxID=4081 RepID=A0A3Q7G9M6_SOLLC
MQQQQQPQPQTLNSAPPLPLSAITTEQIQKFLDENKNLILAILENQNLGKLSECAQYQAMLQKNLMYLAAIADAQPQQSAATSQAQSTPQLGNQMQQTQAALQQQQQQGTMDVRGNKQGSLEGNPSDGLGKSGGRHVNGERE